MHVIDEKRRFQVTIREIEEDGKLGKSKTFSIGESPKMMNLDEIFNYLKAQIDHTSEAKSRKTVDQNPKNTKGLNVV